MVLDRRGVLGLFLERVGKLRIAVRMRSHRRDSSCLGSVPTATIAERGPFIIRLRPRVDWKVPRESSSIHQSHQDRWTQTFDLDEGVPCPGATTAWPGTTD